MRGTQVDVSPRTAGRRTDGWADGCGRAHEVSHPGTGRAPGRRRPMTCRRRCRHPGHRVRSTAVSRSNKAAAVSGCGGSAGGGGASVTFAARGPASRGRTTRLSDSDRRGCGPPAHGSSGPERVGEEGRTEATQASTLPGYQLDILGNPISQAVSCMSFTKRVAAGPAATNARNESLAAPPGRSSRWLGRTPPRR